MFTVIAMMRYSQSHLIDTPAWRLPQRPGELTFKLSAFAQFALGKFSSVFPKQLAYLAIHHAQEHDDLNWLLSISARLRFTLAKIYFY
ncbi:hypothetical protein GCM10009425_13290 [Pseudomonas asuensis]|uniref:Uncharacterized protein n=1 Tax=Pseudomonas asuensis TaxID=1825787 RepID=A0ABQ2GM68_9PSED|nr:hypothetical protein GCM10009425_13290 [Pseudomonas asuensis]